MQLFVQGTFSLFQKPWKGVLSDVDIMLAWEEKQQHSHIPTVQIFESH